MIVVAFCRSATYARTSAVVMLAIFRPPKNGSRCLRIRRCDLVDRFLRVGTVVVDDVRGGLIEAKPRRSSR